MTGKRKQHCRPEKEQITSFKDELVVISKETWDMAQKRWMELNGAWPVSKESSIKQKSYVHSNPTHLLAGLMKCKCCGGAMVQISGKGGEYNGCYNNKRKRAQIS